MRRRWEGFLIAVVIVVVVDVGGSQGRLGFAPVVVGLERVHSDRAPGFAGCGRTRAPARHQGAECEREEESEEPEEPHHVTRAAAARLCQGTTRSAFSTFAIFLSSPSRSNGFWMRWFGTRFKKSEVFGSSMPPVMNSKRAAIEGSLDESSS